MLEYSLPNRRVSAIYFGAYSDRPKEIFEWSISDVDAFFANIDIWDSNSLGIKGLFSQPISGIKQHLANYKDLKVGVAGECLTNKDLANEIIKIYLEKGYDIVEIKAGEIKYTPAPNLHNVKINWKK